MGKPKQSLTVSQRDKIESFNRVTSKNQKIAFAYLEKHNWNVEQAVDGYYKDDPDANSQESLKKMQKEITKTQTLQSIFDMYATETGEERAIRDDGLIQFLTDVDMADPDDISSLIFSWLGDCKTFGEFTFVEFQQGFKKLKATKLEEIKTHSKTIHNLIQDEAEFLIFYRWLFRIYQKSKSIGKRPAQRYSDCFVADGPKGQIRFIRTMVRLDRKSI